MPSGTNSTIIQIGPVSLTRNVTKNADGLKVFGDSAAPINLPPANAIAGANFTNNGDATATATLPEGHTLEDGTADLFWAGGVRYGCTVDVTANSVAISGGAGDALPASATACTIANQVQVNTPIDGDAVVMIGMAATKRAHVDLQDAGGASVEPIELKENSPYGWDSDSGIANPFAGNPITKTMASNGDSTGVATLTIASLEDATP
jgi:hypothetical protein